MTAGARSTSAALRVARATFVVALGVAIVAFAYGAQSLWSEATRIGFRPDYFLAQGQYHLSPDEEHALENIGLSSAWHGGLVLGRYALVFAAAAVIAALLWLRSSSWSALYVAWFLLGTPFLLSWEGTLEETNLIVRLGGAALGIIGLLSIFALLLVFPDDRWARWVFAGGAAVLGFVGVLRIANIDGAIDVFWPVGMVLFPAILVAGLVLQLVGAVRTGDRGRWLLFALTSGGVLLFVVLIYTAPSLSGIERAGTGLGSLARRLAVETALMMLPLLFGAGVVYLVVRRGLWDLDLSLNRAFVYIALTAMLIAVYFVVVVLVQALVNDLAGIEESTLAVVLSTGLIAVLALPARERIQRVIDRVFFRRRYDLERTVESFETRLRDRDRLELVGTELLRATSDAFEPERASLWIPEVRR